MPNTEAPARFEFATDEVVNAAETVRLETLSTPSGSKDFVAVGTSVHRGEDLAVRGAVSRSSDVLERY
jgi:cleavage and polyadenylation specificity factor subunit 1